MAGEPNIRQVIAFPKVSSGSDPLTGAPSPVPDEQLRDLGADLTRVGVDRVSADEHEVEATHAPRDRLELQEEDGKGRKRYRIYGMEPGYEAQEGTDLTAVHEGYISVTPIHFDLTDRPSLDALRRFNHTV